LTTCSDTQNKRFNFGKFLWYILFRLNCSVVSDKSEIK
jgi:hypothetical protein